MINIHRLESIKLTYDIAADITRDIILIINIR